jgi:mannosyltransferase
MAFWSYCYSEKMLSGTAAADLGGAREAKEGHRTAWLGVVVAVAATLRLVALGHKSFWLDEIASVAIARLHGSSFWSWIAHEEGNMALYYLMLHGWVRFGLGETTVRLLSVIPGIAAVPVMYVLGVRLLGRKAGLLAAAFLACNACAIAVSQEARAYSFLVLAVLASTYLFVRLIERPTYAGTCIYGLVAGLTWYLHYFGTLVPLSHALSVAALPADRRPWKRLSVAAVTIMVAGAPVLWMIHTQSIEHLAWVQPPSFLEVYHFGAYLAAGNGKLAGGVLLTLDVALIFLFLRSLPSLWRERELGLNCWRTWLIASGLIAPFVIALLISLAHPVFYHRFLVICLPAWVLMTASAARQLQSRIWRTTAIAGVCALSLVNVVQSYTRTREDWRGVARYLVAQARPEDTVLYYEPVGLFAGENYRTWLAAEGAPRPHAVQIDQSDTNWETSASASPRVWLVLYRTKLDDPAGRAIDAKLADHFTAEVTMKFAGITVTGYRANP